MSYTEFDNFQGSREVAKVLELIDQGKEYPKGIPFNCKLIDSIFKSSRASITKGRAEVDSKIQEEKKNFIERHQDTIRESERDRFEGHCKDYKEDLWTYFGFGQLKSSVWAAAREETYYILCGVTRLREWIHQVNIDPTTDNWIFKNELRETDNFWEKRKIEWLEQEEWETEEEQEEDQDFSK